MACSLSLSAMCMNDAISLPFSLSEYEQNCNRRECFERVTGIPEVAPKIVTSRLATIHPEPALTLPSQHPGSGWVLHFSVPFRSEADIMRWIMRVFGTLNI